MIQIFLFIIKLFNFDIIGPAVSEAHNLSLSGYKASQTPVML